MEFTNIASAAFVLNGTVRAKRELVRDGFTIPFAEFGKVISIREDGVEVKFGRKSILCEWDDVMPVTHKPMKIYRFGDSPEYSFVAAKGIDYAMDFWKKETGIKERPVFISRKKAAGIEVVCEDGSKESLIELIKWTTGGISKFLN